MLTSTVHWTLKPTPPFSDVYAIVCCSTYTQITRTIEHQLSPTFDQTLKFEDVEVIGSPEYLEQTRPKVTILLYHKGPQVLLKSFMLIAIGQGYDMKVMYNNHFI